MGRFGGPERYLTYLSVVQSVAMSPLTHGEQTVVPDGLPEETAARVPVSEGACARASWRWPRRPVTRYLGGVAVHRPWGSHN